MADFAGAAGPMRRLRLAGLCLALTTAAAGAAGRGAGPALAQASFPAAAVVLSVLWVNGLRQGRLGYGTSLAEVCTVAAFLLQSPADPRMLALCQLATFFRALFAAGRVALVVTGWAGALTVSARSAASPISPHDAALASAGLLVMAAVVQAFARIVDAHEAPVIRQGALLQASRRLAATTTVAQVREVTRAFQAEFTELPRRLPRVRGVPDHEAARHLAVLAEMSRVATRAAELTVQLELSAYEDELTELPNRRAPMRALQERVPAGSPGHPLDR